MIHIVEITKDEARQFNRQQTSSYWAIPIGFTLAGLLFVFVLSWWIDVPWGVFWWMSAGIFFLFFISRFFVGSTGKLKEGEMKVVRQAKVIRAAYKGNNPAPGKLNVGQFVEVTVEWDILPVGYPDHNTFEVYRTLGMPYFKQDESLKNRYKELEGKEVKIEYLVQSGTVLVFNELT